ncbi:hypothetical protein MYXO_01270 [Myxococcaceae bacterium]|jgi:hypothetical protein|nr:hypothetical protein MYXO_01270 [Myxococcaceae bacterium]
MSASRPSIDRTRALAVLRRHGITGADVYLIDLIPLIEIIWADGKAQDSELFLFEAFLRRHVDGLNRSVGHRMLTLEDARAFVRRFLHERPSHELLRELRSLVAAVRLASSDDGHNAALRGSLLAACVDIAASAVAAYPYAHGERFDREEKHSFFEILESLGGERPPGAS